MGFVVVERTVIAAHILAAFTTGIYELNLVTAAHNLTSHADTVILIGKWH